MRRVEGSFSNSSWLGKKYIFKLCNSDFYVSELKSRVLYVCVMMSMWKSWVQYNVFSDETYRLIDSKIQHYVRLLFISRIYIYMPETNESKLWFESERKKSHVFIQRITNTLRKHHRRMKDKGFNLHLQKLCRHESCNKN